MVSRNETEVAPTREEEGEDHEGTSRQRTAPETKRGRDLVRHEALTHELALANDAQSLKLFGDKVAAAQELARRMNLALEEQNRLAEVRLRAARKLGSLLRDTVRPGGKSKSRAATPTWGGSSSPLPSCVTKNQSFRAQRIAAIPEEHFERYFLERRTRQGSITFASLLRSARRYASTREEDVTSETSAEAYWERIWDAVTRVTTLDVSVGVPRAKVHATSSLQPEKAMKSQLSGNVIVRTSKEPSAWLTKLERGRKRGRISEAMVLFVPLTGGAWFRILDSGGWICCFVEKPTGLSTAHAVAYIGDRKHAFGLVFRELGGVLGALEF